MDFSESMPPRVLPPSLNVTKCPAAQRNREPSNQSEQLGARAPRGRKREHDFTQFLSG